MAYPFTRAFAAAGLGCVLLVAIGCTHRAARSSVPTAAPPPGYQASMVTDQANTTGWEQTFTPSLPRLVGVEVELIVGNAGAAEDQLTLTVLDTTGETMAVVTEGVRTSDCDQVLFVIPKGGVEITRGRTYRLKLSGGTTFGWKYVAGGYEQGAATFNGRRGRFACSARSCWRRARFSRMRFWREQQALIIQPTRCRSEGNMADILSEGTNPKQRQVFHSRTARSFDEGHPFTRTKILEL